MKDCPCKGCGKRSVEPNCHGYCQEYKDWRAGIWAEKEALKEWNEADNRRTDHVARNCRRYRSKRQVGQR